MTTKIGDRRVTAALLAALLVAATPGGALAARGGERDSTGSNRNEENKPHATERSGLERSGAGPGVGRESRESQARSDEGAQKLGAPKPQAPETRSETAPSKSESAPSRSERAPSAERTPSAERKPPAASKPIAAVKQGAIKAAATARHYGGKVAEVRHLERRAIPATWLRARIMTSTRERVTREVPVRDLEMIHPITRESSQDKLDSRAGALRGEGDQIRTAGVVDGATQDRLIPSKNPIRVIKLDSGNFGVFDGNGRVEAIKQAFPDHLDLRVEVQEFVTRGDLSNAFRRAQASGGEP